MTGSVLYSTESGRCISLSPDGQYYADTSAIRRLSDGSIFAEIPGDLKAVSPVGDRLVVYTTTKYGRGLPGNPDAVAAREKKAYLELYPGGGSQYTVDRYEGSLLEIPDVTEPKREEGEILALNDPYATVTTTFLMSRNYISPDTRFLLITNHGTYIPLYDLEKSNEPSARIYDFSVGDHVEVMDVSFSADSRYAAVAGMSGHVAVYELETGSMVRSFTDTYLERSLTGLQFNRSGRYLMVADYNLGSFRIYSVTNGQTLYVMHAAGEVDAWGFDEATGDAVLRYKDGSALIARMFEDDESLLTYAREKVK